MQGGMDDINMSDVTIDPIPDRQLALAYKIDNAAKERRGISKALVKKATELRTRVMNTAEFTQLSNYINLIIGKKKLSNIKESSSDKKIHGKRERMSSSSEDSAGYDKHDRTRSYLKVDGGSDTMDMGAMEAALAIPVEQLRLADIIDKNIMMADPGIRGGLRNISHQLRTAAFSPTHFKNIQKQIKTIFRNPMIEISASDDSSSSKSKSSSPKKKDKRKRSSS
jgi:hypothetical protein